MPHKDPAKHAESMRRWRAAHPDYHREDMRRRREQDPSYDPHRTVLSLDDEGVSRKLDKQTYDRWRRSPYMWNSLVHWRVDVEMAVRALSPQAQAAFKLALQGAQPGRIARRLGIPERDAIDLLRRLSSAVRKSARAGDSALGK